MDLYTPYFLRYKSFWPNDYHFETGFWTKPIAVRCLVLEITLIKEGPINRLIVLKLSKTTPANLIYRADLIEVYKIEILQTVLPYQM